MRGSKSRVVLRIALATAALAASASAAEPPPPSDAELTKFIAVQDALAADLSRRAEICALTDEGRADDGGGDDLAAVGRRAEASPILGPMLRRQSISGRRYAELSLQVFGVLLGAAIADEADAEARRTGRPANNHETLRASGPEAPPILDRRADLTRALGAVGAMCEEDDGEADHGDEDSGSEDYGDEDE